MPDSPTNTTNMFQIGWPDNEAGGTFTATPDRSTRRSAPLRRSPGPPLLSDASTNRERPPPQPALADASLVSISAPMLSATRAEDALIETRARCA